MFIKPLSNFIYIFFEVIPFSPFKMEHVLIPTTTNSSDMFLDKMKDLERKRAIALKALDLKIQENVNKRELIIENDLSNKTQEIDKKVSVEDEITEK